MTIQEALKRNLRSLMYEREMSAATLSRLTGICPNTIYYIVNGKVNTSLANAHKIAKIFGVTIDELIKGAD